LWYRPKRKHSSHSKTTMKLTSKLRIVPNVDGRGG
jgi:hypothetical protein